MNPNTFFNKSRWNKFLALGVLPVLAVYLVACVIVACLQRQMIYHPPVFAVADAERLGRQSNLERWTNAAGQAIGWRRASPQQPVGGCLLIVYGNASWSVGCAHYVDAIQAVAPLDTFILEYPGYGDRPGSPSEANLFRAADEAMPLLGTNRPLYLVGESLGSGVASYLAGKYPDHFAGVALLSPFNSLTDVAQHHMPIFPVTLLLTDRFASENHLKNFHGPLAIMVDGEDNVVPEMFGLRLYNAYSGAKRLWEFPRGQHVSIAEQPTKFWNEVITFWQNQKPASPRQ